MLTKRIIPCLDVKDGRVVKGKSFVELRDAGDPVELASFYYREGADELVFLDITATPEGRDTMVDVVERISEKVFMPLTVGGGLRTISDMRRMLLAGADKVSINTAAVLNPRLIREGADKFGSQCIVAAIDTKRIEGSNQAKWEVYIYSGQRSTGIDAFDWAREAVALGAGELLLTSMDADGHRAGYDTELTRAVSEAVSVPVIASGGAGNSEDLYQALVLGKADAVLAASIFHYGTCSISEIKEYLAKRGIPGKSLGEKMVKTYLAPKFLIQRDAERCIQCQVCVNQCTFDTHYYDAEDDEVRSREENCVGCHRCVLFCPTQALTIGRNPLDYRENYNWRPEVIEDIIKQAETGGVLLTGMGNDKGQRIYWDHLVLNASQVTNPSIDPLREPMELTTYLGRKPDQIELDSESSNLKTELGPQVSLEVPVMFAAMSYGAVSLNVHESLARAATEMGTLWNTGEGGLHSKLYKYGNNTIVQVASGRFGVHAEYLDVARVIEIKIGQGAKPGIGGHLPGEKVSSEVSLTRMIPQGTDAISPAPQHDIYSIEDLVQLIYALKEATNYSKPVSVKIAAVHNSAAIASGMVRAGADIVVLDGLRGATGAAPKIIRDNVGIPIEMALASVDSRLRQEGIRNQASIVVSGGIRNSGDVAKAIALGADAVYIGTAALIAMGCRVCQQCHTGKCAWGICSTDLRLTKRINPEIGAHRLANLLRGWSMELKDILGGLGVNAIESLRGNRLHLRGVGLSDTELEVLGVRMAGS